jgi:site-specific DNA recombinase
VIDETEAAVVRRIYADCASGMSQRAIVQALTADGLTNRGGPWRQSAVSRILTNPIYKGAIRFKGEVLPGEHEPIISADEWEVAPGRTHRRRGGRHADDGHLLVRGVLRCGQCGAAMIPRKARPGVARARYVCAGRIEYGRDHCDQPSIRRELVDEPFLSNSLDNYLRPGRRA